MSRAAWAIAFAITGGFVAAEYLPGWISTFYTDSFGPLAASSWLGFALKRLWRGAPARLARLSPPALYGLLGFFGVLLLLGGFRLFWVDPWLSGIALAPLWEAVRVLRARTMAHGATPGRL